MCFLMHICTSIIQYHALIQSEHATVCLTVSVALCVYVFQLSKSNCQYHKIFKEISKEEQLRQSTSLMITSTRTDLNTE